jgi:nitroreductase
LITNPDVISLFKKIHNGFARPDQYLSTLMVICFSKSSFDYPLERNQGYTDGGLFSMSIMYALTHLGLASCPLNANLSKIAEKKLRNAINLSDEFGLVMFIAVGHFQDKTIVPVSQRDPYIKKLHHIK